jgi:hypothetical protein
MTENIGIREIFDGDAMSLGRVKNSVHYTQDIILSELLARNPEQTSAVYKETLSRLQDLFKQADTILIEAERALVLPESLTANDTF